MYCVLMTANKCLYKINKNRHCHKILAGAPVMVPAVKSQRLDKLSEYLFIYLFKIKVLQKPDATR